MFSNGKKEYGDAAVVVVVDDVADNQSSLTNAIPTVIFPFFLRVEDRERHPACLFLRQRDVVL